MSKRAPETREAEDGRLKLFVGVVPGVATTPVMATSVLHVRPELRDGPVALLMVPNADTAIRAKDALDGEGYEGKLILSGDLDEILDARPRAVFVEDLSEINPKGSRHRTRLQDVEELLHRGFDVFAAVGVTQLTAARELVQRFTGILPRDTLPDSLLERADEVELTDVSPAALIERHQQGDKGLRRAHQALFRMDTLGALRDLAFGVTRRLVSKNLPADGDLVPAHEIPGRVLVLLTRASNADRLVRAGHRLAESSGVPWSVGFAKPGVGRGMRRHDSRENQDALKLADALGADLLSFSGQDFIGSVMDYARANQVTDIVVGRPSVRGLRRMFRRPVADRLMEAADEINVHLVGEGDVDTERISVTWRIDDDRPWFHGYLVSAVAAFIAAGLIRVAQPVVPPETLSIVMLMAVIYSATAYGFAAALFTSVLGIVLFNFFFVPPRFDFIITSPENLVLLATFVVLAGITSNLAGRLHDQAATARRRERHTAALFRLAREVASAPSPDDVLKAVVRQLNEILNVSTVLFLRAGEGKAKKLELAHPQRTHMTHTEWAAAEWVMEHGRPAGPGTGTYEDVSCLFWPLRTPNGPVGVACISGAPVEVSSQPQFRRRLDSLAGLAAVAIERMMLSREIERARFTAQTEGLRAALLSSISHDLRTPLASIIGSATSLLSFGKSYSEEVRHDLLKTILEEAERLNRFVGNLLQMTKLEAGAVVPKRQWIDVDDLIGTTVERMESRLSGYRIETQVTPLLPPIYVDFVLMENVVTNLLDNAVKYSSPGSTITIRGYRDGDRMIIEVCDEGIGIAAEDHAHVFDKFFRVYARDSVVAGTGLGLAICKGIVESHGGTIGVRSDGLGKGTVFRIELPFDRLPHEFEEGTEHA